MVSFTNIRLAQKAFTNVLAYLTFSTMTEKKVSCYIPQRPMSKNIFTTAIYKYLVLVGMFVPGELFHSSLMLAGKA